MIVNMCTCGHPSDMHSPASFARGKKCNDCDCVNPVNTGEKIEIPAVMVHPPAPGNDHHTGGKSNARTVLQRACQCSSCAYAHR